MCCVGFCLVLNACGMYCGFVSSQGFYPVIDCLFGIIFSYVQIVLVAAP